MNPCVYGIRGFLLTPTAEGRCIARPDAAICWDEKGVINFAGPWNQRPKTGNSYWLDLRDHILTPGFADVHCHLPQYPAVGCGNLPLLPWLKRYIFPLEKQFTPAVAKVQAPAFFRELQRHGITSASVYTTADAESTEICFQAAEASGLRIAMGHMMMDRTPEGVTSSVSERNQILQLNEQLCHRWHGAAEGRLRYAFSPRFALTCTAELMQETAKLADQSGAWIQTHLSENREEVKAVKALFPNSPDYTGVYESCGLLGPRTIMGHAIYLSDRERQALSQSETKVAHCPSSNLFLRSGVLDLAALRKARIPIGLGSDVAGGPELNPWEVMKAAAYSHHLRTCFDLSAEVATPEELFAWATSGGAEVLGWSKTVGRLEKGFAADIAAWNISQVLPYGSSSLTDLKDPQEILARLIYRGQCISTAQVWVQGKSVWQC